MCAARAYGKAGKLKEAIADFDTAIKLNPSFYQAYANRALVQRRLGRDDLAFADYNRAIQINPSYDVAYVGRGNIYRQRKQLDLALADFNQAIELDANDPRAYHNRGLIYQAHGQHSQAIDDFSKAISLAPTGARAVQRPRPLLSRHRRLQGGARGLQRGGQARPAIPTRAGPTRAWRWRSSASARRPSPPSPAPPASTRTTARPPTACAAPPAAARSAKAETAGGCAQHATSPTISLAQCDRRHLFVILREGGGPVSRSTPPSIFKHPARCTGSSGQVEDDVGLCSQRLDDALGHLLGVAEQHHGVVAVEQRVVDAGIARAPASA